MTRDRKKEFLRKLADLLEEYDEVIESGHDTEPYTGSPTSYVIVCGRETSYDFYADDARALAEKI
jgi:hypothetical protein